MTDLKLLDELLLIYMRERKLQPADLETDSHITREVLQRLRTAWSSSGELRFISATFGMYFRQNPEPKP